MDRGALSRRERPDDANSVTRFTRPARTFAGLAGALRSGFVTPSAPAGPRPVETAETAENGAAAARGTIVIITPGAGSTDLPRVD
jgi:hypothetical protein